MKVEIGSWVASFESNQIAKVKNIHLDGSLDVVIYSRTGDRLGRTSPAMGGPTGFEPCCGADNWTAIAKPKFPLMKAAYLEELVKTP